MPACYYRCFSFAANIYGWYAWSRQTSQNEAELKIRWLPLPKALSWLAVCVVSIGLMTVFINPVFAFLTRVAVMIMQALGLQVVMPELQPDAFPFWDSCMMVLSIVAMILMTRKYVENWLLWVIINVISVVICTSGRLRHVSGVHHPDLYCPQRQPDVDQQRTRKRFTRAVPLMVMM
ncbi:nicotinamide riboside transporter PnuC [Escherichia coli]|nr:nicotinamide riboside transporter PnuC [Escherichia coli]